ncbi:MAG: hypothetical protein JWQ09_2992 [Segetibacter sp.]|nr:hypothetical protein [Segetibacter sp.]
MERIKEWFLSIDPSQQIFISSLFLYISPLNSDKEKSRDQSVENLIKILESELDYIEEVGFCLAAVSIIDYILLNHDNVDYFLDGLNFVKEIRADIAKRGGDTSFDDEILKNSSARFSYQKDALEKWNKTKADYLTLDKIRYYQQLKAAEAIRRGF